MNKLAPCSLCGCTGIHACMGKPTTEFKATKENLKALVAAARKSDNKTIIVDGDIGELTRLFKEV